jgi:hypothetical protein
VEVIGKSCGDVSPSSLPCDYLIWRFIQQTHRLPIQAFVETSGNLAAKIADKFRAKLTAAKSSVRFFHHFFSAEITRNHCVPTSIVHFRRPAKVASENEKRFLKPKLWAG